MINFEIFSSVVDRLPELNLLKSVSHRLGRDYSIIQCSDGKSFGVVLPS